MMKDTDVKVDNSKRFQIKASPLGAVLCSFATRVEADEELPKYQAQQAYATAVIVDMGVRPSLPPSADILEAQAAGKTAEKLAADEASVVTSAPRPSEVKAFENASVSAPTTQSGVSMHASSHRSHSSRPSR